MCVDFDGTLADENLTPLPGAVEWLTSLTRKYEVVVLTCRAHSQAGRELVETWCVRHAHLRLKVTNVKPDALWYLDNKAWRVPDFPTVEELGG